MKQSTILNSALRTFAFVIIAKILIALREIALAAEYGAGKIIDAYNVALTVSTWLPIMFAAAAGAALVPELVRARTRSSGDAADNRFVSELNAAITLMAATMCAITVLAAAAAPLFLTETSDGSLALIRRMMLALAPFSGATLVFYYLSMRLQSAGSFSYTIIEAVPALLLSVLIYFASDPEGFATLAGGTIVGGFIQVAALLAMLGWIGARGAGFCFHFSSPRWRLVLGGIGAMAIGQVVLSASLPIDQYYAVQTGEGTAAVLGYANRLIGIGTSVGTLVLARALLPALAGLARSDPTEGWRQAKLWAAVSFGIGTCGLAIGWPLAEWVTRTVFERGAFGPDETRQVAQLLRLGMLQLPFYFGGVACVQWLAVNGRFKTVAAIACATLAAKMAILIPAWPALGAEGIVLSTTGMYVFAFSAQIVAFFVAARPQDTERSSHD